MDIIEMLKGKLTDPNDSMNPRTIVFTEGMDPRILETTKRLVEEHICNVVLVSPEEEVHRAAGEFGLDLTECTIVDPETYSEMDDMVEEMVRLRKGKVDAEKAREMLMKSNYFGTMLVKMGKAHCLLGGATYSTADTIRPALQLVKTKPGHRIVTSCYLLIRGDEVLAMADCVVNIDPTEEEIVDITIDTAETAKVFGIDPKIALLSYSTRGSGKGASVDKMRNAAARVKELRPDLKVEGEIQFDAAVSPEVAGIKCKDSEVAGQANTFIFPDINSGNITYKCASRLGGYEAVGPVLQGLNAPINDLSRGSTADEIYKMAIITAALS